MHLKGDEAGLLNLVLCVLPSTYIFSFFLPPPPAFVAPSQHVIALALFQSTPSPAYPPHVRYSLALVSVRPPCPALFSRCVAEATTEDLRQ